MTALRAGILGAGYIARAHAAAYAACDGVDLVAIADPVGEKATMLAGLAGAQAYDDPTRLLELDLDVVSICTPSSTHADIVIRALGAGLNVLCEKPIARTLADGRRIVDAAAEANSLLMIAHVSRYEPDHAIAHRIISGGGIGTVRMLSQSIVSTAPTWSEKGWLRDHDRSGGPLVDLAIHSFDYLAWVCGEPPVRVQALASDTAAGPDTYVLVTLRYANGAIGLVEASWAHPSAHGFQVMTEVSGSAGRLWWDYDGISGGRMATDDGKVVTFDALGNRGFVAEVTAFVGAIRAGGPSPVPATEGLLALRTALAAEESVQAARPVSLDEIAG